MLMLCEKATEILEESRASRSLSKSPDSFHSPTGAVKETWRMWTHKETKTKQLIALELAQALALACISITFESDKGN